jgi:N-acetylglucosaminyl-diphospho-decaprenol L-rhamnosyltransferase
MIADRHEPSGARPERLPAEPRVLVSIVAMSCEGVVVDCLRAIAAGDLSPQAVVIVENGGADAFARLENALRTADLIAGAGREEASPQGRMSVWRRSGGLPLLALCDPGANLGYAGGNNLALAQSLVTDWDAAWILNPDTAPAPAALRALAERQRETGFGMIGSRLVFTASDRIQTWGGLSWSLWLGRGRYRGYMMDPETVPDIAGVERRIDFISGASMFVTRRYIADVGPMDHSFFMYGEDVDWCLRGRARGHRFGYAHASLVRHIHGATAGSSRIKARRSAFSIYFGERNKVLLMRKHLGRLAPIAMALALLATAEHLVRSRSPSQFRIALRGWWAGVRGETGYRKL